MSRTLVLNATYEPLSVVPLRRAVVLVLAEKATVVEQLGRDVVRSERLTLEAPSVVRLNSYVRVPFRRRVPLSRRGVMQRDGGRCVYCSGKADTIDHVVPRSRGGTHVWGNVVAACARCNHRKSDRLLAEIGWQLTVTPREPAISTALGFGGHASPASWQPYLSPWTVSSDLAS